MPGSSFRIPIALFNDQFSSTTSASQTVPFQQSKFGTNVHDLSSKFSSIFRTPILDLHKSSCITKYSITAIFDSIVSSRNFRNIIQVYKSSSVVDLTRLGVASNVYASMSDHYTNEYIFTQAKFPPSSSLPFAFSMSDLLVDIVPCKIFSIRHFGNSSVTLEAICFH